VVELQFVHGTAVSAASAVAIPDELLDIIGNAPARRRWSGRASHCDGCLRSFDPRRFSLLTRDEQGVDLIGAEPIIVPVEGVPELPVGPTLDSRDGNGLLNLLLRPGRKFSLADLAKPIFFPPDPQRQPAFASEDSRLV
jgi:hypothetical protein